jgi:hypothetical protein
MDRLHAGRLIAYLFFGLFAVPPLLFAGLLFRYWLMIQFHRGIYLEYPYLATGLVFLCLGILEVFCVMQGMRRRGFGRLLLAIPVILGFATMINVPEIAPKDREGLRHLSNMITGLDSFDSEHGHYPETVAELEQTSSETNGPTRYRKNGQLLHHRAVLLANASGPYSGSVGDEPGVLFYAVTSDYKEAWLTETELDRPVGGHVQFVQILTFDGFSTSLHRQVSTKRPAN